ncbi:MAG TPA: HEPN domain-containing protein [Candidatus Hydrogenedentes bacterium]|nr:HEPN domain-containing protein [Candidatus Hydrogenedentota bacterium]HPG66998.1 HEPN domain-containing protein [Candidatus Hydrogenedentota bacterium]
MRPEDEVRTKLVGQWMDKATQDLLAADALMQQVPPLVYPVCLHCQQASEKYLKAYLTQSQVEFTKTHNIAELLDPVASVDDGLAQELAPAAILTPYGVDARYPGDLPEPSEEESRSALGLARQVAEAVTNRIE